MEALCKVLLLLMLLASIPGRFCETDSQDGKYDKPNFCTFLFLDYFPWKDLA
jgi:hypothetical protein